MADNNEVFFTGSRGPVLDFKKGLHNKAQYNDPTYLGFLLLFDWNSPDDPTGSYYNAGSPLLSGGVDEAKAGTNPEAWETREGTAMDYLKRSGEFTRMKYLNAFINTLKTVNYYMPWYWQEIEGLDSAVKTNGMAQPYSVEKDAMVKIKCLESIDLKMTSLMDFYKNAVYDFEFRRVIIPENLRKFRMTIHVEEIRKFQVKDTILGKFRKTSESGVSRLGPDNKLGKAISNKSTGISDDENFQNASDWLSDKDSEQLRFINGAGAKVTLDLQHCEFIPDESAAILGGVGMSAPEKAEQMIAFKYERVREQNMFPLKSESVETRNSSGGIGVFDKNKLSEKVQGLAKNVANSAINDIKNRVSGYLKGLVLGNVHGLSPTSITGALQQGTIQGISRELGEAVSSLNQTEDPSISGKQNVHGPIEQQNGGSRNI